MKQNNTQNVIILSLKLFNLNKNGVHFEYYR